MKNVKPLAIALGLIAASTAVGCASGRPPETYRDDTQKLLDTTNKAVQDCYQGVLKTDKKAQGSVTVNFTVEENTGKLTSITVDKAKSSAPDAVQQCVTGQLGALHLDPPDQLRGWATFTWDFKVKVAPAAPADAGTPAT